MRYARDSRCDRVTSRAKIDQAEKMASTDDWLYNDDLDVNIPEVSGGTVQSVHYRGEVFLAV